MHLYPIDGAVHRVGARDTAWSNRDAKWSMVIVAVDPDPAKASTLKRWGRAYWEAVHPYNLGGAYVNFMDADENDGRVEAAYGANYRRLQEVKRKIRPRQPLPGKSEHPAGRLTDRFGARGGSRSAPGRICPADAMTARGTKRSRDAPGAGRPVSSHGLRGPIRGIEFGRSITNAVFVAESRAFISPAGRCLHCPGSFTAL